MATGLLALLDDVAGIAKLAASTLDDAVSQAGRAGLKAAGVVIDDAAVTPRYIVGFASERELPIIGNIAIGSLRNKLLILLPLALILSAFAPWSITPLLMLGGAFLCYEGTEKVLEAIWPHGAHEHEAKIHSTTDPAKLEEQKVRGAIKTDFILSAEIMAITLASIESSSIVVEAIVLAIVGAAITGIVYGAVALIVKADDAGLAMAAKDNPTWLRKTGRAIVAGMPTFLRGLAIVGTAAMIWVGGGIVVHGLEELGWHWPADLIHDWAVAAGEALSGAAGLTEWVVGAALSGLVGLIVGAILIPIVHFGIAPILRLVRGDKEQAAH